MNKKEEVMSALSEWIIRVTDKKGIATPEEIAALPKVAELFLKHYSLSVFPSVKKE
ncbi:hypothetical protein [Lysinibacillus alkalisoli]|nr:hypothetical protein [Lysinibacillus alkalisoli]